MTDWLLACRPKQWTKNVLVFAAALFSGRFLEQSVLLHAAGAFVAFTMVAAAVYLINDISDREEDCRHPKKAKRPIAAGRLAVSTAGTLAAVLLIGGLALGGVIDVGLLAILVLYVVVNLAYSFLLRSEPVFDIAVIALGFLLRAVAGGAATGIALSNWFLLITTFGALFMASGKRYAEARALATGGDLVGPTRPTLGHYTTSYLRFVWSMSAGALLMSYALWAFQVGSVPTQGVVWTEISMAPFMLAVLRYAVDVDAGRASEPEDIALQDRGLQLMALAWVVCVIAGVYVS